MRFDYKWSSSVEKQINSYTIQDHWLLSLLVITAVTTIAIFDKDYNYEAPQH